MSRVPLPTPPDHNMNKWLAQEQNALDHLTRKLYGPGVKFERLSAWGQNTIESLAREKVVTPDQSRENSLLKENEILTQRLAKALQDYEDLWEENEQLRIEAYEIEESNSRRSTRRREVTSLDFVAPIVQTGSDDGGNDSEEG